MSGDLFGGTLPIPLSEQIKEVEREIAMRRSVYPRQVASGRMSLDASTQRLAVMTAVLDTLRRAQP